MFLDINKIGPEGLSLERSITLSGLRGPDGESFDPVPVAVAGRAAKGNRGVHLRASFRTDVELHCSRCLEPFRQEIEGDFFLILVAEPPDLSPGEFEVREEDAALFHAEDGRARLEDIVTEQLYLRLPLKPVCHADCSGLCPRCGGNRNRTACECRETAVDPRLAPLAELKKRRGEA